MLANLYRDEPKPLPSPHEEAILPVARLVRDEWMHTVYRGPADTDNLTQETYEKRDEYRSLMLKEPAVSAAFWSRIASVMTLIPKVHAQDPDNPAEVEVANFVKDAIGAVEGGWPRVIGSFAAGGLLDGFSVCELVYDFPERGKWRNKRWVLKEIAPLDGRFIRFDIDSFKRVVGVRGLKANAGQVFGVDRFAIYSHQQLFNNPFGISQFRAAYRAAKMMESAIKLRIILLQNFTGPFVAFKSASPETRASAMRIVAHARSQGFLVCDKNDDFTVTNMASGSDSEFQSAMDDLRKEMYTAICWGYLPFVEGREGAELGNSTVQKSITELGTWRLATGIAEVINRDIVRPLVRANIADETINFPFVSLGGQNTGDKKAAGDVFEQAKRIGVTLSKKQIQRAMDLEEPNGPEDELKEMPTGGMAGAGNPFSGMPMGDDGGMPPDAGAPPPDGSPVPDGGAPMPEGDDATPAAPGQPQAVKPGGSVDLSRWNPRIGKTDTAEMDKAAMIAILDLQARAHRAGSPGRFQKAIDALRSMIGNHPAMHLALAGPPDQAFGWRPEPTRTGGIKAINTENPQYILYGEKAKQALNDHPDKPKVAQESHERYQGVLHAKSRAQELAAKMMNGGGGSSAEYKELAGHVQHLSVNEIYAVRKTLMGSFSNAHKRAEMVSALSTYALRQAGESVPDAMPGQPSFRAPKKGMTAGASAGGSAPPPAAPPTAPTAAPSSKGGVATNLLKDHLDASQGLTPAQWDHYHGAIDRATAKMPAAAHERIARNLQGATFHAKSASIGDALYKDAAEHSPDPAKFEDLKGQKIGVGYCTSKGTLHINGDLRPGAGEDRNPEQFGVGKYAPAHEVYAHALGRVIDGPNYEMSSSKEWGQAFNDEIAHGGAQYGTHPLSRFASMSPEQGFAEFSRLVYGSKVPAKEVAERFPQATAFFQKNGLLPGSEAPTAPMAKGAAPKLATVPASAVHPTVYTAPALSEAFDKKVVVAKDGSHVDTLKPLTEETPKPVEKKSPFGRDELKAKPPIRNFMVGVGNIATMQFDSNMQKRLYDVGSKQRQSMRGKEVKGGGSGMAAEIAMLAAASGRKPGEIRNLSSEVYDDVRKQMKGAKDGEHRDIVDNHDVHGEKAKPTQATNDAPAPVLPARTDPNPGEAIPAAPGASLDLNDHKALASAVHDAASQLPDMFGKAANGPRGDWDGHKVLIGDTFDQMKKSGKLPESATLDQFKDSLVKANAGGAVQLSRLDLPNIYDQRGGVGRWKPSEIQHVNGTFHAINVPGSKITPRVGQDAEPAMTDSPHAKNPVLDAEMAKPDAAKEPHEMTKAEYVANRAKVTRDALEEWNAAGNKGFPPSSGDGSIAERNKLAEAAGLNPGTPEFAKEGMGDMHRLRVRAALAAGKTVPPHVLADYPDLAAKGSTAPKAGPATPQQIRSTVHDTFDDLLREKHHTTGMVPLHEIRQAIADKHGPDAASHKVFDEHLKDLRREKKLRLISISDRSKATGQQLQDSVPGIGENFFYAEQGPNFGDLQAEAAQHRKASAAATAAPDAKPASPPFAPGTKETAESVLERVKASPNQPADRDWDTHAQQHGIEGDFTHVEIPTKTLTDNVFGGHLRRSNSVDQNAVDKKVSSGERNPVLITKEPGRGSLVVDGNHSLAAAMQAGDPTVQAIVSEKSALHPKGEAAAPTEPKTRHEQNGWTPENHVKIAADSIDKLRGVDVDRVLDSAPPELLDKMADHIRTNRPDLKDTVDAVHTDIKRERKQATNKVNDDQQRMEQNAKDADAIPRVSNDDFANGDWDQAHAGLSSEAVAIKMALGMKGIDGREYGIREHSRGKWQMVSKPMGAGASTERPQSPDAIAETPEKAAVGGNESVRDSSANAAGADSTYTPPVGDRLFDLGEAKRLEPHHAAINGTLESAGWRFGDAVSPKGKLEDAHDELKNLDDHLSEKSDSVSAPHQGAHQPFGSLLDSHKEVLADIAKGEHDLGDYGTTEDRTGDAVSAFKDGIDRDGLHRITNGLATNGHLEDAQWASRHHDKLEGSLTKSIEQAVKARHAKAAAEASTPDEHGVSLTPKQREEVEKNGAHKAETDTGDETYVVHPAHLDKAVKLAASLRSYIPAEKQRAEQYRPRTEARKRADSKWQQMERQASSIDEQIAKHRGESEPEAVAETAPAKEVSPSHVDAYRKANERVKQPGGAVGGTRMKQDVVGMVAKEHGVGNGEAEALLEGAAGPKGGTAPAVESPMSEPDKVETGGSMHPDQLRQAMANHPGKHIVNRVDDANYETYGPDGKLSKSGIPVGELEKELQRHLKQGHRVAVVEPTPKKSGFSPVSETPKAETPAPVVAAPAPGKPAHPLDITKDNVRGVWEQERDAIIKTDRKLSPNAAGSLAAARILNHVGEAAREFIGQTDEKVRQGKPVTDAEDERYIHASDARKNLHTELVNLSGYRPMETVDEHPEAMKPISSMDNTPSLSLADKLKERTAGIDPDEVKAALASHAEKAAWHEKRTTALTDALEAAKKRKREVGSRQPEARNATKEVNKLQKEHDAAYEERGNHGNNNAYYKARLQAMAMDPSHPEFLRLAAASQHAGKAHPNTAAEITPAVREHLKANGHDPALAEAVAGELAQSPLRATTRGIDGIIQEEKTRAGHVQAKKDAKAHIQSLGLPDADARNAMNDADSLYSDRLDDFKKKWSGVADGRKAETERQASAKAESEKRMEASKKADAEGEAYVASVKAGHPDANASPDAVQRAIRHVAVQAHEWHEDVQLPAGKSAKEAVNEIIKAGQGSARWGAMAKTITEKGWVSDTKYMMKATPDMVAHAKSQGVDKIEGRVLPVDDILPKKISEYDDAKIAASQVDPVMGTGRILMKAGDRHMEFDPKFVANIVKHYPDAQWKMGKHTVVAVKNGEVVGLVMPFNGNSNTGEVDAPKIATGKRLAITDVAEPGPFKAEDVKEIAGKLKVGEGTDMAATLQVMGGRDNQVYLKGAGTDDRMYGSAREAIAAGKEILAHSHGTDEDGNIIFKPKGAGTTELTGEAKTKRDYYAELRERAKAKPVKKSTEEVEGLDGSKYSRDLHHVSDSFHVAKDIKDKDGKESGYVVIHTASGQAFPGKYDKKADAIAMGHAATNVPGHDWTQKFDDMPDKDAALAKLKNTMNAFDEDAYHPDMGTFGKDDDAPGASPAIREPQDKPTPGGAEVAGAPKATDEERAKAKADFESTFAKQYGNRPATEKAETFVKDAAPPNQEMTDDEAKQAVRMTDAELAAKNAAVGEPIKPLQQLKEEHKTQLNQREAEFNAKVKELQSQKARASTRAKKEALDDQYRDLKAAHSEDRAKLAGEFMQKVLAHPEHIEENRQSKERLAVKQAAEAEVVKARQASEAAADAERPKVLPDSLIDEIFQKQHAESLSSDRFKSMPKEEQDKVVADAKARIRKQYDHTAKRITERDPAMFSDGTLDPSNKNSRRVFEHLTGTTLPKTVGETNKVVRAHIGEEALKAHAEAKAAKRAEEDKARDAKKQAEREKYLATPDGQRETASKQLDGYGDDVSPMIRARIVKTLDTNVSHNGVIKTRRDLVRELVGNGFAITKAPDDSERLQHPDGRFHDAKSITGTGMSFAKHLIAKRGETAAPAAATEQPAEAKGQPNWRRQHDAETDPYRKHQLLRMVADSGRKATDGDLSEVLGLLDVKGGDAPNIAWAVAQNPAASPETKARALSMRDDWMAPGRDEESEPAKAAPATDASHPAIRDAIAKLGGPSELTTDNVDGIRKELYSQYPGGTLTHSLIRDVADQMKQSGGEPTAPPTAEAKPALHPFAQEQFNDYRPIIERQAASETSPRRQWGKVDSVLHGLNPDAQKALLEHLATVAPEAYEYGRANPPMHLANVLKGMGAAKGADGGKPDGKPTDAAGEKILSSLVSGSGAAVNQTDHPDYAKLYEASQQGLTMSRDRQSRVNLAWQSILDPDDTRGLIGSSKSASVHVENMLRNAGDGKGTLPNVGVHGDAKGSLVPPGKGMRAGEITGEATKRAKEIAKQTGRPVLPVMVKDGNDAPKGWAFLESPVDIPAGRDISNSLFGLGLDANRNGHFNSIAYPQGTKNPTLLPFDEIADEGPLRSAWQHLRGNAANSNPPPDDLGGASPALKGPTPKPGDTGAGANPTGSAGLPAELTPQVGGEAPQATKKNPFREEHDKLQKRIESLTGQTSHDKAMENAFPFGTGRPGNASSQRTAKASAARIETTVNNAVKANELIKKRNELKAKADQFDSGIIDEHGRETPETLKARAEKQAVAKKGMDAVNDYMRETLKPGDTVYHSNGATVVKRVNPTGITTESGAKFKYDELAPKHATEDRAMTTRELMDLAQSRTAALPASAPETESAPTAPTGYSLADPPPR